MLLGNFWNRSEKGIHLKIKKRPVHETIHIDFKKGTIESDREEDVRIWQRDGDRIYVTCPQCSMIAAIETHEFSKDGEVRPCVVCDNCRTHYFPRLLGWDGSYTLTCGNCSVVAIFKAGEKDRGWGKYVADCSCCSYPICPKCTKGK